MNGHTARAFYNGDKPDHEQPLDKYDSHEWYLDKRIEELKEEIDRWKAHPSFDGPDGEDIGICHCDAPGFGCMDMVEECENRLAELISKKRFRIND